MKFECSFLDEGLSIPADMTSEVLADNEDLLHQLSAELGLGTFLEDPGPAQDHMDLERMSSGFLEDEIMQDLTAFQDSASHLFPEMSSGESGYGGSVKSEPSSPFSFPPSPTGSDHSDGAYRRDSPPLSPQQSVGLTLNTTTATAPGSPITFLAAAPSASSAAATLSASRFGGKIPIPKIKKPLPSAAAATGPIVLTLGSDGLYYPASTSLLIKAEAVNGPAVASTTASFQPLVATAPAVAVTTSVPATTTAAAAMSETPATSSASSSASSYSAFRSYCSPLVAGLPTVNTVRDVDDLRNMKRQQRMIKNRESACISRKKKKEYVTSLEAEIKYLSEANLQLRMENESLKERVKEFESERKMWTETILSSNGKKATAVFAVIFMVSLNFNSLSGIYNSQQSRILPVSQDSPHGGGRSLLWSQTAYEDGQSGEAAASAAAGGQDYPDTFQNSSSSKPPLPMCPMFFNQSESIRLESELRGWFSVDPVKPPLRKRPDLTSKPKESPTKTVQSVGLVSKTPLPSISGSLYHVVIQDPADTSRSISLFDTAPPRHTFASFFEAIDRREDTFYVVSFSGDHLLVPATNHSQANRPRMSLLLPALTMALNDSHRAAPGSIAMMKIDCEVMNTQLVHIKQDSIPAHLAANLRTGNLSGAADFATDQQEASQGGRSENEEEKAAAFSFGKNYRNSVRMEGDPRDKDNTTMEAILSNDIPPLQDGQLGKHNRNNNNNNINRRKRKPGAK